MNLGGSVADEHKSTMVWLVGPHLQQLFKHLFELKKKEGNYV